MFAFSVVSLIRIVPVMLTREPQLPTPENIWAKFEKKNRTSNNTEINRTKLFVYIFSSIPGYRHSPGDANPGGTTTYPGEPSVPNMTSVG